MKSALRVVLVAVMIALATTACSSAKDAAGPSSSPASAAHAVSATITVFAASSLTGTFNDLGTRFEEAHPGVKVVFNYGSSGTLAAQITQGAPADVFASAAPKNMQTVLDAQDASTSTNFAKNTMEVVVPAANPAKIVTLADLARPGVKLALCVTTAPCGATADEVFAKAKLTVAPVTREADAKTTISKITLGEADAAVVYVTDVKAATGVTGIPIPSNVNATTEYPIATLTHAGHPDTAAAFVAYVLSSTGRGVLSAAGFLAP